LVHAWVSLRLSVPRRLSGCNMDVTRLMKAA
jgi:hypothetical protein